MKKYFFLLLCTVLLLAACKKQNWSSQTVDCLPEANLNPAHKKGLKLQDIMDRYTAKGVVGVSVAVYDGEGLWTGASGYAKIESGTKIQPCHLQYSQSVSKTYMAVSILKLAEEGKIDLDKSITNYLPAEIHRMIGRADQITVRMLMNHTSGIPEYNINPNYVIHVLQHPLSEFQLVDYIRMVKGKTLKHEPGTHSSYANTNYTLLAMIADQITGDHIQYMKQNIFAVAGMNNTYYHESKDYLDNGRLVNSYWDRYGKGRIENCSEMQKTNVKALVGDDGMIATPVDYVLFIKALIEGKIISQSSLSQMLTFHMNSHEKHGWGLGIFNIAFKEKKIYWHGGDGIGATCFLVHFPEKGVSLYVGVNLGTVIESPLLEEVNKMKKEMFEVLIE